MSFQCAFQNLFCEWCSESTLFSVHCWPENVCQASLWLCHCFCLLFALFMCALYVMDAVAWHIQTFESSTRQNHTQENSVQWDFFPLAASLDTSWHDHLIKESAVVTSVAKAIYTTGKQAYIQCAHAQQFIIICSSSLSTYQRIKNTHKNRM